ncbi:MAG: hypothetical protein ACFFAE_21845 [Candidatus Hodarchaeota archaeon]
MRDLQPSFVIDLQKYWTKIFYTDVILVQLTSPAFYGVQTTWRIIYLI